MLQNNSTFSPFMSTRNSLSAGLNPLGMRTASEQLFTTLLPGMNVVTLRIRYYSFYCWTLKKFYVNRERASLGNFRSYIRKSEFLMALIHAYCDDGLGIPGINVATQIIENNKFPIDIAASATPDGKNTGGYWKGALGALGTYYAASLQEMGLIAPIVDQPHFYNITKTEQGIEYVCGEALADAFEESIGRECSDLFKECIMNGYVTAMELEKLGKVFRAHYIDGKEERELLKKMLLQVDHPTSDMEHCMRKETIGLLLGFFVEHEGITLSEVEFAEFVYQQFKSDKVKSAAAVGWYAFYLNDCRQYEALCIFEQLLNELKSSTMPGGWEKIDEFADRIAKSVCNELKVEEKTLHEVLNDWTSVTIPNNKMAKAFYNLLDNYVQNMEYNLYKDDLKVFFSTVRNDALEWFEKLEDQMDMKVHDCLKLFLTSDIIYNHYAESMRKFSQTGVATQKLAIENGEVRWLGDNEPSHSSPRIRTLSNFVSDLGLVSDYKLTSNGQELLKELAYD